MFPSGTLRFCFVDALAWFGPGWTGFFPIARVGVRVCIKCSAELPGPTRSNSARIGAPSPKTEELRACVICESDVPIATHLPSDCGLAE